MKSRLVAFAISAAVAVFLIGGGCSRKLYPPEFLSLPDSVYAGEPALVRVFANGSGYDSVRYVVNWDDGATDTTGPVALGEAATASHVWTAAPDTRYVRAAVFPVQDPKTITWAEQERVLVVAGGSRAPVIDSVRAPSLIMRGVATDFLISAHDPDGDSIRIHIDWGDGRDTTSELLGAPHYDGFYPTHAFAQAETAKVVITAQDRKGAVSLPDTAVVRVDTTGGVLWSYWAPWVSPLVVNDGVEDCIYYFEEDFGEGDFHALTVEGSLKYAPSGSFPSAGVAYCAATQHIVGGGLGLWAMDRQLHVVWSCETPESSGWSDPAVSGDRIYLGNDDTLYCFIDSVDHGVRAAALVAQGVIVGAPVVDAYDAVYFGTDSGFLYKVGPGLDTIWRSRLTSGDEVYSPIISPSGIVYCASSSQRVYAVDAATGATVWTATLVGVPSQLALGQTLLFTGTDKGREYALNPADGAICWEKTLSSGSAASAPIRKAPVVAANGTMYTQNDSDVVFKVNQADGAVIWQCDCPSYLPAYHVDAAGRYRRMAQSQDPPSPTILPNGNIIVAGLALYCVAGDPAGPLDPLAPWPKWQHDLYNTGCVSGGR
ncbi:MAG TPA: PQQ-binding-like beta-propeller repeat protein [bacterium]|nr:PQQ-binding-like beta-propeller repeat protein [bacterium]